MEENLTSKILLNYGIGEGSIRDGLVKENFNMALTLDNREDNTDVRIYTKYL
jgi:hypothetical protein